MKLFTEMSLPEKLAHIEKCQKNALEEIGKGSPSDLADIADHVDLWGPWMLEALREAEKVSEFYGSGSSWTTEDDEYHFIKIVDKDWEYRDGNHEIRTEGGYKGGKIARAWLARYPKDKE